MNVASAPSVAGRLDSSSSDARQVDCGWQRVDLRLGGEL
jgi:hypothetical protein